MIRRSKRRLYEGDAMETWDRGLPPQEFFAKAIQRGVRDSLLCTTKPVLNHYWEEYRDGFITTALLGPYTKDTDEDANIRQEHYGLEDNSYQNCDFAFFSACNSNANSNSILWVLREKGGVQNVLGYTRDIEYRLANEYVRQFWQAFEADELSREETVAGSATKVTLSFTHKYRGLWAEDGLTTSLLQQCAADVLGNWWKVMKVHLGAEDGEWWKGLFKVSDNLDTIRGGEGAIFVRFNATEVQ